MLTTAFEQTAPLHRPILVLALQGLFDMAGVATAAVETLLEEAVAPVVATIDPDPFFDFTQQRPQAEFDDDGVRTIRWPTNEFRVLRFPDASHDLVVLSGVEPHLRYRTFADAVVAVALAAGCEVVVTLGAVPEAVPHTRPPAVVGSSTNTELARALGLARPRYEGPTGLVGVLQERLDQEQLPAVSLRVGVPHYLAGAEHPQATVALLQHLEHVLGVPTRHSSLRADARRWRALHDEAVAEDRQAALYVAHLEREHDRRTEAALPSADDLAAEFERFLRGESDGESDGESGDEP